MASRLSTSFLKWTSPHVFDPNIGAGDYMWQVCDANLRRSSLRAEIQAIPSATWTYNRRTSP